MASEKFPFPEPYIASLAQQQEKLKVFLQTVHTELTLTALWRFATPAGLQHAEVHNNCVRFEDGYKVSMDNVIKPGAHPALKLSGLVYHFCQHLFYLIIGKNDWCFDCCLAFNQNSAILRHWATTYSVCLRFCHAKFNQHAGKWAKFCAEKGWSKQVSVRWLNEAGLVWAGLLWNILWSAKCWYSEIDTCF